MRLSPAWLLTGTVLIAAAHPALAQHRLHETDLQSDLTGRAAHVDLDLVNPWGIVPGPTGVFWVSDNGSGKSTLYQPDGSKVGLVVDIPGGGNTGVDLTSATEPTFRIPSGDSTARAIFVFVSEAGIVSAWNNTVDLTHAITVATTPDAIYKGVAIGISSGGPRLYAANFAAKAIDVFDAAFARVTAPGGFVDPRLPAGYSPFNVANIGGRLYIAFALKAATGPDEVAGAGLGLIDVFDTDGHFLRRFTSHGALNAPWAMVLAPPGFGGFGNAVLVGNFGDGAINAYSPATGAHLGAFRDSTGAKLSISGLWGLHFGRLASGPSVANRLYFAAGIDDEAHGLFGFLTTAGAPPKCDNQSNPLAFWQAQCGAPARGGKDAQDAIGVDDVLAARPLADEGDGVPVATTIDAPNVDPDRSHGPSRVPADSLRALYVCAATFSRAFGPNGCFPANCDVIDKANPGPRARAARQFLVLLLDRCAGLTCDSAPIHCAGGRDDDGDDDDARGAQRGPRTVGELVAVLDSALCAPGSGASFDALAQLAACATREAHDKHDLGHDAASALSASSAAKFAVYAMGGNPVRLGGAGARFLVSSPYAVPVRFQVFDAAGRLVAEPIRDAVIAGQQVVRWDGSNQRGVAAPSGTYFYRATAGASVATGRIVMVR